MNPIDHFSCVFEEFSCFIAIIITFVYEIFQSPGFAGIKFSSFHMKIYLGSKVLQGLEEPFFSCLNFLLKNKKTKNIIKFFPC